MRILAPLLSWCVLFYLFLPDEIGHALDGEAKYFRVRRPLPEHRLEELTRMVAKRVRSDVVGEAKVNGNGHSKIGVEIRESTGMGVSTIDFDLSIEQLAQALDLMEDTALIVLAGGRASRFAEEIGYAYPKSMIDKATGQPVKELKHPEKARTSFHTQFRAVNEVSEMLEKRVPVIIYDSDQTRQQQVNFLRAHRFFGSGDDIAFLNFQEFAPTFSEQGDVNSSDVVSGLGLGHGEIFRALRYPPMLEWLRERGVKRAMITNIEGAAEFSPHLFAAHGGNPGALYSLFLVPVADCEVAPKGGMLREVRERAKASNILLPNQGWRPTIVEGCAEEGLNLPGGSTFNTNVAIFELEQILALAAERDMAIDIEKKRKNGVSFFQGKTGHSAVANWLSYSSWSNWLLTPEVSYIVGPQLATSDLTIYEDLKNQQDFFARGRDVLAAHDRFWQRFAEDYASAATLYRERKSHRDFKTGVICEHKFAADE